MRYQATVSISDTSHDGIAALRMHPGQWVDYDGSQGRFMGLRNGCVWIAWAGTARKRFATFALAFHS